MVVLVAVAAIAAYTLVVIALLSAMRQQARAHARREDLLLNQLLHATGNAWSPPPVDEWRERMREARDARREQMEPIPWTATPEQLPND